MVAGEMGDDWRKIENIVLPEELNRARDYTCSICIQIWDEPVEAQCGHIFCSACLGEALACPECRTTWTEKEAPKSLRDHNKPMFWRLNAIGVRCPHNKNRCEEEDTEPAAKRQKQEGARSSSGRSSSATVVSVAVEDGAADTAGTGCPLASSTTRANDLLTTSDHTCDWQGNYSDLLSTHMKKCPFWVISCPAGCGEKFVRKDIGLHEVTCPKSFTTCPICQDLVKDLDAHRAEPETKDRHLRLLEKKVADLENSRTTDATVKKLERDLATTGAAVTLLGARMAEVKQLFPRYAANHTNYVWKIKNFDKMCRDLAAVGASYASSEFFVGGCGPFTIEIYPNGETAASEGHLSVFLCNKTAHDLAVCGSVKLFACKDSDPDAFCGTALGTTSLRIHETIQAGYGWGTAKMVERETVRTKKTIWFVAEVEKVGTVQTTVA